jgi:hypothetical protein
VHSTAHNHSIDFGETKQGTLNSGADQDPELVAFIDNELEEAAESRMLARLVEDDALRKSCEELRETGASIAAAFDALIATAPLSRLRALCPSAVPLAQSKEDSLG